MEWIPVSPPPVELFEGAIGWAALDPVRDREQGGHRPVLVVSTADYLAAVTTLAIVLPITSRNRGWRNHVAVTGQTGLPSSSWAMTEQPRTISRDGIVRVTGIADGECLENVRIYLRDFLGT